MMRNQTCVLWNTHEHSASHEHCSFFSFLPSLLALANLPTCFRPFENMRLHAPSCHAQYLPLMRVTTACPANTCLQQPCVHASSPRWMDGIWSPRAAAARLACRNRRAKQVLECCPSQKLSYRTCTCKSSSNRIEVDSH